jgi:3-dehydroquinate dehydratase-1
MNTIKIRNLELGAGTPAICIPNTGKTKEEILTLTHQFLFLPMDLMEWRADCFEDVDNIDKVIEILSEIRTLLNNTPLLFTFRTTKEGGTHPVSDHFYSELIKKVAMSKSADLIDVEIFTGDDTVTDLIHVIHQSDCKVIASNHDFEKTPSQEDIVARLCKMQNMNADVLKIAVMPHSKKDVLTLLSATEEMLSTHAKCPVVSISMSDTGTISRIAGEFFGSCMTFGCVEEASAPGQIHAMNLKIILDELHHIIHF